MPRTFASLHSPVFCASEPVAGRGRDRPAAQCFPRARRQRAQVGRTNPDHGAAHRGFQSLHVWSETYDRGLGDLFAVQDESLPQWRAPLKSNCPESHRNPARLRISMPMRNSCKANSFSFVARRATLNGLLNTMKRLWRSIPGMPGRGPPLPLRIRCSLGNLIPQ